MSTDPRRAVGGDAILVALSALVMAGHDEPVVAPDAADSLDRLAMLGRTVILAGPMVAGRRLPEDPDTRERWVKSVIGTAANLEIVTFAAPAWERRDAASEVVAHGAWADLRARQRAAWLITDRHEDIRPARRAGLRIVQVGPRPAEEPLAARAEIEARDLPDAARLLLAQDLFGQIPAA